MAHTPGPWKIVDSSTQGHPWLIRSGNEYWVADLLEVESMSNSLYNAYLIAAAPDLLEACEGILKHINDVLDDQDLIKRRNALFAAIAKAKGKS